MRNLGKGNSRSEFNPQLSAFFLTEGLAYSEENRRTSAEVISALFKMRQEDRGPDPVAAADKRNNCIVAVPGSPGSGKTTFLLHFAVSPEYENYLRETGVENTSKAIVAPVTFNSKMTRGCAAFGLRIMYGAAKSMGFFEGRTVTWKGFAKSLSRFRDIDPTIAVEVLREIFGNRRVLILVDNIKKAAKLEKGGDDAVMGAICTLLSNDGTVDVLVSALSPTYMRNLVLRQWRCPIYHVPLSPLHDLEQGRVECELWCCKNIPT